MIPKICMVVVALGLFTGCRPELAPTKEVKPLAALEAGDSAAPAPPPPDPETATYAPPVAEQRFVKVVGGLEAPPMMDLPAEVSEADAVLIFNRVIRTFVSVEKRSPKTVEELVSAGLVSSVPTWPNGRRLVVDGQKNEVRVEP